MHRKLLNNLDKWLNDENRKPLIIRGARQVGKSTLVRLFAERQKRPLAEVNLERFPALNRVFESMDPEHILRDIEALPRVGAVIAPNAILFLDEIQATPAAIAALRYFYEERKDLPVLSAGSLLEFALTKERLSMPVGRIQYLHMEPMTFTEFLEALDEQKLKAIIDSFSLGHEIGAVAHERLLQLLRIYCFVGGMPAAVAAYAKTKVFRDVSPAHHSIMETYREDFQKYAASRDLVRMQHVLNFAARNVGVKIKYSNILPDTHSATIKQDLDLLAMARVISRVVHTQASGLPLQADLDDRTYKLIFLDIGLMNALCGLDWHTFSRLSDRQLVNDGVIAEQFVGQHLRALLAESLNRELTYWLREGRASNAEVDFVIALHGQIVPMEVKAGGRGRLRSLHQFMAEKRLPVAVRFDTNPPSVQQVVASARRGSDTTDVSYKLISLPLYLAEKVEDVVRTGGGEG
jgi:predicted AAA+ superfamily ATPase